MIFCGIDPGKSGAIVFVDEGGALEARRMPLIGKEWDLPALASIFVLARDCDTPTLTVLERVHAMPKQGVSSTFTFGVGYGLIQGLLAARGWPFQLVPPKTWQRSVLGTTTSEKEALVAAALRLFPALPIKRKADWGMADAALMAEHARRLARASAA